MTNTITLTKTEPTNPASSYQATLEAPDGSHHSAVAADPFTALVLVVNRAFERGWKYAEANGPLTITQASAATAAAPTTHTVSPPKG